MILLQRNKQSMYYSKKGKEEPIYHLDENGNIKYYVDQDGNSIPLETGSKRTVFSEPILFSASISNKLNEVLIREFGIDDSTNHAQIVTAKGLLPLSVGDVIWKKTLVGTKELENGEIVIDEETADYTVKGVADEGLDVDLFLLQRNIK